MGRRWLRLIGLATALGGGCTTSHGPNLKTPMPEQYTLPPTDDSRFAEPVSYPKDVLNQEPIKPASPSKVGGGPGGGLTPAGGMAGAGRGMTPGGF
jgi:hypothetical protein